MIEANKAIRNMKEDCDVDTIADLQDDLAENMQEVIERNKMFAEVAEEGKEDLLAELDELEADVIEGQLNETEVSNAPIA